MSTWEVTDEWKCVKMIIAPYRNYSSALNRIIRSLNSSFFIYDMLDREIRFEKIIRT